MIDAFFSGISSVPNTVKLFPFIVPPPYAACSSSRRDTIPLLVDEYLFAAADDAGTLILQPHANKYDSLELCGISHTITTGGKMTAGEFIEKNSNTNNCGPYIEFVIRDQNSGIVLWDGTSEEIETITGELSNMDVISWRIMPDLQDIDAAIVCIKV